MAARHNAARTRISAPSRRDHLGLALYPMEFVSFAWRQFVGIYAELPGFPQRQVLSITDPAIDLCGCVGATEYDLFHSQVWRAAELARANVPAEAADA